MPSWPRGYNSSLPPCVVHPDVADQEVLLTSAPNGAVQIPHTDAPLSSLTMGVANSASCKGNADVTFAGKTAIFGLGGVRVLSRAPHRPSHLALFLYQTVNTKD